METGKDRVPVLLDQKTWCAVYGGTRAMFYRLVNRADVPAVVIGGRKFLVRDKFDEWLAKQASV